MMVASASKRLGGAGGILCGLVLSCVGCGDEVTPRSFPDYSGADEAVAAVSRFPADTLPWGRGLEESAASWNDWYAAIVLPLVLQPSIELTGLKQYIKDGGSREGFSAELMSLARFIDQGQGFAAEFETWEVSWDRRVLHQIAGTYLWVVQHGTEEDKAMFLQACGDELRVLLDSTASPAPRLHRIAVLVGVLKVLGGDSLVTRDKERLRRQVRETVVREGGKVYWPMPGIPDLPDPSEMLGAVYLLQYLDMLGEIDPEEIAVALKEVLDYTGAPFSTVLALALLRDPGEWQL